MAFNDTFTSGFQRIRRKNGLVQRKFFVVLQRQTMMNRQRQQVVKLKTRTKLQKISRQLIFIFLGSDNLWKVTVYKVLRNTAKDLW